MAAPDSKEFRAAEEELRHEFNQWAERGRGGEMAEEHAAIAEGMLAQMRFEERDKILDIGCGAGWFSALLARKVPTGQVVGIDVADDMVRRARATYAELPNAMFLTASAGEIPWDEDFFNKVVSIESAYYWPDVQKALREVFRVLRPGGTLWILINLFQENTVSHQWREKLSVSTHLLSGEEWTQLLCDAGLTDCGQSRVPDPRPVADDFRSPWFRSPEDVREFRRLGALLLTGRKPDLGLPPA